MPKFLRKRELFPFQPLIILLVLLLTASIIISGYQQEREIQYEILTRNKVDLSLINSYLNYDTIEIIDLFSTLNHKMKSYQLVTNFSISSPSILDFSWFNPISYSILFYETNNTDQFGLFIENQEIISNIQMNSDLVFNESIILDLGFPIYSLIRFSNNKDNILLIPDIYFNEISIISVFSQYEFDLSLIHGIDSLREEMEQIEKKIAVIRSSFSNNILIIEFNDFLYPLYEAYQLRLTSIFSDYIILLIIASSLLLIIYDLMIYNWLDKVNEKLIKLTSRGITMKLINKIPYPIYLLFHFILSIVYYLLLYPIWGSLYSLGPFLISNLIIHLVSNIIYLSNNDLITLGKKKERIDVLYVLSTVLVLYLILQLQFELNIFYNLISLLLLLIFLTLRRVELIMNSIISIIVKKRIHYRSYSSNIMKLYRNINYNQIKVVFVVLLIVWVQASHQLILGNQNLEVLRIGGDIGTFNQINNNITNEFSNSFTSFSSIFFSTIFFNDGSLLNIQNLLIVNITQLRSIAIDKSEYSHLNEMLSNGYLEHLDKGNLVIKSENYLEREYNSQLISFQEGINSYNYTASVISMEYIFPGTEIVEFEMPNFALISLDTYLQITNITNSEELIHRYTIYNLIEGEVDNFYKTISREYNSNKIFKSTYISSIFYSLSSKENKILKFYTIELILFAIMSTAILYFLQSRYKGNIAREFQLLGDRGMSTKAINHEIQVITRYSNTISSAILFTLSLGIIQIIIYLSILLPNESNKWIFSPLHLTEWIFITLLFLGHTVLPIRNT